MIPPPPPAQKTDASFGVRFLETIEDSLYVRVAATFDSTMRKEVCISPLLSDGKIMRAPTREA